MRRFPTLLLVVAVACAAAPPRPADQIDVWVPPGADEATTKEWAEALAGNAPPGLDHLPPHDVVRRVNYVLDDDPDWRVLFQQARGYARSLEADAVILSTGGMWKTWGSDGVPSVPIWPYAGSVHFVIVRYR